jgi:chromosome segregation ATPase
MKKSNAELQAQDRAKAEKQVEYWDKQIATHQKHMADLKRQQDEALEKAQELATNKAVAEEYLEDLLQAAKD